MHYAIERRDPDGLLLSVETIEPSSIRGLADRVAEILRSGKRADAWPVVNGRRHKNSIMQARIKSQSIDSWNDSIYALCEDGIVRRVRVGEADTFFSRPARVTIGKTTVKGFVTGKTLSGGEVELDTDPALWHFIATKGA